MEEPTPFIDEPTPLTPLNIDAPALLAPPSIDFAEAFAAPAAGSPSLHIEQQQQLVNEALFGKPSA